MALTYNKNEMGTFTLVQKDKCFKIRIRQGNAMAIFLNIYKKENPENQDLCWVHQLVTFFANEEHLKRCLKNYTFNDLFGGEIKNIKLNLCYKESKVLLKYLTKAGYKVTCFYKEEKE